MIERMNFPLMIRDAMREATELDSTRTAMSDDEFCSFYQRTARPLWAYLSRITGDPHQADDVLQEAYYRLYRAAAQYESESHRRNSLFQIATNLVRDAARRGKRYEEVELAANDAMESRLDHQTAAKTDVSRAMEKLAPVQREMLWLAYAEGASHDEIAEILGLRAISVRTLLLRARRKLAAILTGSKA